MLLRVEKPARYIGNEINMVVKDPHDVAVRFAFCYPDVYEVGMSHLGMQIIYHMLNKREDVYCERVFAPWVDMEAVMRSENIPLYALETGDAVKDFDFFGITLQYEMSCTNIVNVLDLSGIPIWAAERSEDDPIVCGGGPCVYNPEPLADFFDFFFIGEAEAGLLDILDAYKQHKASGGSRREFLISIANMRGIYVPALYDVSYKANGEIHNFTPKHSAAPSTIRKVFADDLNNEAFPTNQLIPLLETVHDRVTLEIFRGCIRGCRFCQAGYVYRPYRERSVDNLTGQAEALLSNSGCEEISLVSLSTSDYTGFTELTDRLTDAHAAQNINISLPSMRVDAVSLAALERIQEVRKSSLTFAPEAGTQRMRDVINKGIDEQEILEGCRLAYNAGWDKLKLYFMIGLPTETDEDVNGIVSLAESLVDLYYKRPKEQRIRQVSVNISTSAFVPKPFTAFQWMPQDSFDSFMRKQRMIKDAITKKQIKYRYHNAMLAVLEGVIARGDRRVSAAIYAAWKTGARFDGWTEYFKPEIWHQAFNETGLSMDFYTSRERSYDEVLPWDFIDAGVSKDFLINECEKAHKQRLTPNCREGCGGCGFVRTGSGCVEK